MEAALSLMSLHESSENHDPFTVSHLSDVASFFGLAEPTVRQWTQRDPPIPGEKGAWNLREIVRWREQWLTQSDLQAKQRQQAFELGNVKLESDRLELAQKRKQLVHIEDVELWAATAIIEFRDTVMQLKEMLTSSAPPEMKDYVREEVDRHCRDALTAAARRLEAKQISEEEG